MEVYKVWSYGGGVACYEVGVGSRVQGSRKEEVGKVWRIRVMEER